MIHPRWGLRRPAILRPIVPTKTQARRLYAIYVRPIDAWEAVCRNQIIPEYERTLSGMTTDSPTDLEFIIEREDGGIVNAILSGWKWLFQSWIFDISEWHLKKFVANIRYATDIDLTALLTANGEPETVEAILQRNVNLVRSVSDQTRERIADIVFRGVTQRTPVAELTKQIRAATGLSRARARRIASDQTTKLSAALDRARLQEIGVTSFIWQHSGKAHPREWHLARDGKRFSFNDPALRGDMPGDQPFCGCRAKGVLE